MTQLVNFSQNSTLSCKKYHVCFIMRSLKNVDYTVLLTVAQIVIASLFTTDTHTASSPPSAVVVVKLTCLLFSCQ